MHANLAGQWAAAVSMFLWYALERGSFFCRYAQVTKRTSSGHKQIYDVVVQPQQQAAVVKFARDPYPEQVHVDCANKHLAPELLGVYCMPGGFTQVQSMAWNRNACDSSRNLQPVGQRVLCDCFETLQQQLHVQH